MATVTFLKPDMSDPITVRVRSQEKRTLLSLLTQLQLFDPGACERRHCGACAVKVMPKGGGGQARPVRLDTSEKAVLFEAGRLSREQCDAAQVPASPGLWRLACRYVVRYEEIIVAM